MRSNNSILIVATAGLLVSIAGAWALGEAAPQPAGDFQARLDEAVKQLAAYDFGGETGPLNTITQLIAATQQNPAQRKEVAAKLATVLGSGAPRGAKDFACRQLSLIGTEEAVPALAPLLADDNLSHMARYALERIPGAAPDEALRQALGKVKGKLLVGVINSLGNRRDAGAVGDLAKLLADADPPVAAAAAAALGKIGPAAAATLTQALASAPPGARPAVAEGCLLCAEALLVQGKPEEAVPMYGRVRGADVPKPVRVAATRGAILARQAAGLPLLVEQLQGADAELFGLALALVREMPGPDTTKAVAAELGKLPAERQVALLEALADRGDRAATPEVLKLTQAADALLRAAAIRALVRLGDASAVPMLFQVAAGEGDDAQAARATLANLPGQDVDAAVMSVAGSADAKLRRAAVEMLGQRRVAAATALLLKAAGEADESVRLAAIKSLGDAAEAKDFAALVGLMLSAKAPGELAAAEAAVAALSARMPDPNAGAEQLAASLGQAGAEVKAAIVRALGRIGGPKALAAVRTVVADSDANVRDTAVRVLAEWADPAAAPDLLAIAKTSQDRKQQILALRGYIRLIGVGDLPADQKLAMCKEAIALADRDEEKKLVLGALGGVPSAEALAMAVPYLDGAMKDEAAVAAVAIGEKIVDGNKPAVAEARKKVLQATQNADVKKRAEEVLKRAG